MNTPLGRVAGSAAIIKDKKILLPQRSYKSDKEPGLWTFPSGGLENFDNSVAECVIREVKEETGLDFFITGKFNFYDGILNGKRYVILVHLGEIDGTLKIDFESEEARYVSYNESLDIEMAYSYRQVLDDLHLADLI